MGTNVLNDWAEQCHRCTLSWEALTQYCDLRVQNQTQPTFFMNKEKMPVILQSSILKSVYTYLLTYSLTPWSSVLLRKLPVAMLLRPLGRPARSQSLYRLSYPGSLQMHALNCRSITSSNFLYNNGDLRIASNKKKHKLYKTQRQRPQRK
jgi:hypothetical protein